MKAGDAERNSKASNNVVASFKLWDMKIVGCDDILQSSHEPVRSG